MLAPRRAGRGDLPGVVACLAAAFEAYRGSYTPGAYEDTVPTAGGIEQRFRDMTILVVEDGAGRIIGTISYHFLGPGVGHLRGMGVAPEHQGRQVAERLLVAAESGLRALGCSRVTLDTTAPLERAIGFYTRHGYRATGGESDFFGMTLYEYAKPLAPGPRGRREEMSSKRQFTAAEAKRIGDAIGVDWAIIPLEQFRIGLAVELEHGRHDASTNVTDDDEIVTGKIALAHLNEFPDYYDRLGRMEKEADAYWAKQRSKSGPGPG
jgi:GNAT superfamily N-acetyltransferase